MMQTVGEECWNHRREVAQKRWKLLIDVLMKKSRTVNTNDVVSVRRFQSFGLLNTKKYERDITQTNHCWYEYTSPYCQNYKSIIRHLDDSLDLKDLLGFNNTGNVCVWPSEEVLAYYLMKNTNLVRDKVVCELGGGMTCIAGIAASICGQPKEVLLTDGNEKSVQNVETVISRNMALFGDTVVNAEVLQWDQCDKFTKLHGKYDVVICADCLFFDECQEDLVRTLEKLLKPGGEAIMFAPNRNGTFHKFSDLVKEKGTFEVNTDDCYDQIVWELYQENLQKGIESFDEDIHYPLLMVMKRLGATD